MDNHRVLNGRKASGVPKRFSEEELQKRRDRLALVRHKAVAAIISKAESRRKLQADQKEHVKRMASLKVFVPVGSFEKI